MYTLLGERHTEMIPRRTGTGFPCNCNHAFAKHLYNETSTTSADPEFKEIKYDPGLLGCLIIIMLSLCRGRGWAHIIISLFFVYLTLWISRMEKWSSVVTVELVGDGSGQAGWIKPLIETKLEFRVQMLVKLVDPLQVKLLSSLTITHHPFIK